MTHRRTLTMIVLVALHSVPVHAQKVTVGADLFLTQSFDWIKGKRIGLVVNHTSVLSDGRHLVDLLSARNDLKVTALFAPEHGLRGDTTGAVPDGVDPVTHVPVFSLYGTTTKPTAEMMQSVDLLVFDIQDVGARFYTYISTLGHCMEAAAERGAAVIVLDRPNPVGGDHVEGPLLLDSLKSFVGFAPIPILHGMTVGELAMMYNGEGWLKGGVRPILRVVKMERWERTMWYDQTGLRWVKPSPNMPTVSTAAVYPGTCLFEGTNVSEGRGTDRPFEYIGAPWLNSAQVIEILENAALRGVEFEPIQFTPVKRPNNVEAPKFADRGCNGLYVRVTDRETFEPVRTGIYLLWAVRSVHPDKFEWRVPAIDERSGTTEIRMLLDAGEDPEKIVARWRKGLEEFRTRRAKYLLYR